MGQPYQSYVAGFPKGGKFWRELVAGAKRGGGGGGGGGEKREGENPTHLLFSFPPDPLPLSTAATQATRIAIKTTPSQGWRMAPQKRGSRKILTGSRNL